MLIPLTDFVFIDRNFFADFRVVLESYFFELNGLVIYNVRFFNRLLSLMLAEQICIGRKCLITSE